MATVLIADDNQQILSVLERYAIEEGYQVILAHDGQEVLDLFARNHVSLVLLDVMMPRVDGFEVCRRIRQDSTVPIILITARGEDFERIMGLDIGADDYIVKPFSPGEVMARIRAILRRMERYSDASTHQTLTIDNLKINLTNYRVTVNDVPIGLTKRAIEILWTLASKPQRVFTRESLLSSLWGEDYRGEVRAVDSQVKRMRIALQKEPHPNWDLKTVWGVGYQFEYTGK